MKLVFYRPHQFLTSSQLYLNPPDVRIEIIVDKSNRTMSLSFSKSVCDKAHMALFQRATQSLSFFFSVMFNAVIQILP